MYAKITDIKKLSYCRNSACRD